MGFEKRDADLQNAIITSLMERQVINMNKETGVAYMQAEFEDKVNPCVKVTRDDIREETGRVKVRDVVMDDFERTLRRNGIDVTRLDEDTIKVCVTPVRAGNNEFGSLTELRKRNTKDVIDLPELAEPPY
jgi:hypothetical protein